MKVSIDRTLDIIAYIFSRRKDLIDETLEIIREGEKEEQFNSNAFVLLTKRLR
jgi:hypothetical protein